jgi:hypothetical protein
MRTTTSKLPLYILSTFVVLSSVVAVPNPMQAGSMSCFVVFTFNDYIDSDQLFFPPSRVLRWAGDYVRDLHWQGQSPAHLLPSESEHISFAY